MLMRWSRSACVPNSRRAAATPGKKLRKATSIIGWFRATAPNGYGRALDSRCRAVGLLRQDLRGEGEVRVDVVFRKERLILACVVQDRQRFVQSVLKLFIPLLQSDAGLQ